MKRYEYLCALRIKKCWNLIIDRKLSNFISTVVDTKILELVV